MKKLIACVCLTIPLVFSAFGQKNQKPKVSVIWGPELRCHEMNTAEVKILQPECSSVQFDTVTFYIVKYAGVYYAMSHRPARNYIVTSVQISNKTDSVIQVNPLRSRMVSFKGGSNFTVGSKGDLASAESQDDLRQATYRESTLTGERDGGIRTGLRVQERYEDTVDRSGRIVSRVTRNEPAAPPSSNPTPSAISNNLLIPKAVFDNVLKSKTIGPGEKMAGHIVFKSPESKDGYMVFYLNAGPMEFVFPGTQSSK